MVLAIEPKAQSRPRFGRHGRAFEDKKMKSWRRACRDLVRLGYRRQRLAGSVRVKVTFYVPVPQYIRRLKYLDEALQEERIYCDKRPDLDNYIKAVLDSISDAGCVWQDDNQVVALQAEKKYSLNPRIEVEVEALRDD